jgi:predicted AAA+ superfamily ATPase
MIKRDIEQTIIKLLTGFPIVTITGPRQSGKTTLAQIVFRDKPYISLEDPDARRMAFDDPRAFLNQFPDGGVLDEVQRAPELVSYLQTRVDSDGRMGLFLLTGSQQFGLMSGITQSLAGRTAFIELLPFSINELNSAGLVSKNLDEMLFKGSYPPIYDRRLSPPQWRSAAGSIFLKRQSSTSAYLFSLRSIVLFLHCTLESYHFLC